MFAAHSMGLTVFLFARLFSKPRKKVLQLQTLFYLAPFLRYGDLLAENCEFFLPQCHLLFMSSALTPRNNKGILISQRCWSEDELFSVTSNFPASSSHTTRNRSLSDDDYKLPRATADELSPSESSKFINVPFSFGKTIHDLVWSVSGRSSIATRRWRQISPLAHAVFRRTPLGLCSSFTVSH